MRQFPLALAFAAAIALPAAAEPTEITVRVLARGAKFIPGSVNGARVLLHDAETGELLAEARTTGGTGDTSRIMGAEHGRTRTLSSGDAAKASVTLDIERATRVRLTVDAPLHQPQAALRAIAERWILPGKHVTAGDGWAVELPGLVVDVDAPGYWTGATAGEPVMVAAHVSMLCGCGVSENSLWNAQDFDVEAVAVKDGDIAYRAPLAFAGTVNRFEGAFTPDEPGVYEIEVRAFQSRTGSAGVDRTAVVVR